MYSLISVRDTIRILPRLFAKPLDEAVTEALKEQYEGRIDKDLGVLITVLNPRDIGDGKIIPGDGAAYHDAVFDVLVFKPEMQEVVRGKVVDITEFGAFVRFGPVDGLVHVSQITDDFVSFSDKTASLAGRESHKILKKGDVVNARITAISMKSTVAESKINLTMRQPGLGKDDWYGPKAKEAATKIAEEAKRAPRPRQKRRGPRRRM
jgi:DNA-directed RNA polymerase subunit E'